VTIGDYSVIVSVTSADGGYLEGCWWTLHSPDGRLLNHGRSKGYGGSGMGSALTAMKIGRAAAKRFLKNESNIRLYLKKKK